MGCTKTDTRLSIYTDKKRFSPVFSLVKCSIRIKEALGSFFLHSFSFSNLLFMPLATL